MLIFGLFNLSNMLNILFAISGISSNLTLNDEQVYNFFDKIRTRESNSLLIVEFLTSTERTAENRIKISDFRRYITMHPCCCETIISLSQLIVNNIIGDDNYSIIYSRKSFYDSLNKPITSINELPKENCIDYIKRKLKGNPHPFYSDFYPNVNEYTSEQIICEVKKRYMIKVRPSHFNSHYLNVANKNSNSNSNIKNSWKKDSLKDSKKMSRVSFGSESINLSTRSSYCKRQKLNSLLVTVIPKSNSNNEM